MNTPSISPKPFLSHTAQISMLEEKGLYIQDNSYAIKLLEEHSYFALISGYKKPFKQKNGNYKPHTSLEDIYSLYEFDNMLRSVFLRYILKVEKHIKSLVSYFFCEEYGEGQQHYLNATNYNYAQHQKEINAFIHKLEKIEQVPENYPYITYQKNKYNNVPLWVMMKALTFGNVSKMFTFLPLSLQARISKKFPDIYENSMPEILGLLSRVRNVCAHNERLFNYKDKHSLSNTDIHKILNLPQNKGQYSKGKKDLLAILIALKYFISEQEFKIFIEEIAKLLDNLCRNTQNLNLNQMHKYMGFPDNWQEIATCPRIIRNN